MPINTIQSRLGVLGLDRGLLPYPTGEIDKGARASLVNVFFYELNVPLEEWEKSYLGKMHHSLVEILDNLSSAEGYNYNDPDVQENDFNKVGNFPLYQVMIEDEFCLNEINTNDNNAFANQVNFKIHCYNKLESENDNSKFAINNILNKMLQDVKRVVGNNPKINNLVSELYFRGAIREDSGKAEDIFIPKKLVIDIEMIYNQERDNPLIPAF